MTNKHKSSSDFSLSRFNSPVIKLDSTESKIGYSELFTQSSGISSVKRQGSGVSSIKRQGSINTYLHNLMSKSDEKEMEVIKEAQEENFPDTSLQKSFKFDVENKPHDYKIKVYDI